MKTLALIAAMAIAAPTLAFADDDDDDAPVDKYIPFSVNALDYDDALEFDDAVKGQCKVGQPPIGEPDAQVRKEIRSLWYV